MGSAASGLLEKATSSTDKRRHSRPCFPLASSLRHGGSRCRTNWLWRRRLARRRKTPFGYRAQECAPVPDPEQAAVVRWIFEKVGKDCWTIRKISEALDDGRRMERRWHPTDPARILAGRTTSAGTRRILDPRLFNRARSSLRSRQKPDWGRAVA